MNKTYFAELKEKLGKFDGHKSQASMPRLYEHIDRVDLWITAQQKQHTKSSAIISELIEIIQSQSEALDSINNDFGFFHHANKRYIESGKDKQDVTKIGAPIRIATGKLETCVSETTTRLQKLREGK